MVSITAMMKKTPRLGGPAAAWRLRSWPSGWPLPWGGRPSRSCDARRTTAWPPADRSVRAVCGSRIKRRPRVAPWPGNAMPRGLPVRPELRDDVPGQLLDGGVLADLTSLLDGQRWGEDLGGGEPAPADEDLTGPVVLPLEVDGDDDRLLLGVADAALGRGLADIGRDNRAVDGGVGGSRVDDAPGRVLLDLLDDGLGEERSRPRSRTCRCRRWAPRRCARSRRRSMRRNSRGWGRRSRRPEPRARRRASR